MARPKVKLNRKQIATYQQSEQMRRMLLGRAQRVAGRAGPGFDASAVIGATQARASVITSTYAARADNSRRQTLLRSL